MVNDATETLYIYGYEQIVAAYPQLGGRRWWSGQRKNRTPFGRCVRTLPGSNRVFASRKEIDAVLERYSSPEARW